MGDHDGGRPIYHTRAPTPSVTRVPSSAQVVEQVAKSQHVAERPTERALPAVEPQSTASPSRIAEERALPAVEPQRTASPSRIAEARRPYAAAAGRTLPHASTEGSEVHNWPAKSSMVIHMPTDATAERLAADSSGIARRAGVKLCAWPARAATGGQALLEVVGDVAPCAVACYLVQVQLCLWPGAG